MSSRSVATATPAFSRHIHCLLCQRPKDEALGPDGLPPTTFWLTSCACIICEGCLFPQGGTCRVASLAHAHPDCQAHNHPPTQVPADAQRSTYTCPACHSANAKMIIMGEELPPPVAPYFRSVTQNLEELIDVHRFQMTHMSQFIDYLRTQVDKQRKVLNRVRKELLAAQELKNANEALRRENEELWSQLQEQQYAAATAAPQAARRTHGNARSDTSSTFRFEPPGEMQRRRSASPPLPAPPSRAEVYEMQQAGPSRGRASPRGIVTSLSREPATRPPTTSRIERVPTGTSERLQHYSYTPTSRSDPNGVSHEASRREEREVMGPPSFTRSDAVRQTPSRRPQAETMMPPPHSTPRATSRTAASTSYVPSTPQRSHRAPAAPGATPSNRQVFDPHIASSSSASRFSTPRHGAIRSMPPPPATPHSTARLQSASTPTHRVPFTPHRP